MTTMRMTGALVSSCRGCPHNRYYSGNRHECTEANQVLPDGYNDRSPAWCPLPVYPSGEIARLEAEVQSLQEFVRNERGQNFWVTFCHLLSNYLGIKFDPLVYPLYCTLLPDNRVVLVWEHVESISLAPLTITFRWQAPDKTEPLIYKLEIPVSKTLYGYGGGPVQAPTLSVRRMVPTPEKEYETWDLVGGFPVEPKAPPPPPLDTNSG